jgi:hypothetical protein
VPGLRHWQALAELAGVKLSDPIDREKGELLMTVDDQGFSRSAINRIRGRLTR